MYARAKTVWKTARRSAHHLHNFIGRIVEIAGIFDTLPSHAFDIRWRARAVHENTAPFFSSSHFFRVHFYSFACVISFLVLVAAIPEFPRFFIIILSRWHVYARKKTY